VLKIGTDNYASSASAGNTNPSFSADNVLDTKLTRWQSSSTIDTLTVSLGSPQSVTLIALFNVQFSTLTATGKNGGVTQFTANLTSADLDGVDIQNCFIDSIGTIDTLELVFNGGANVPFVGYVHCGASADFSIEAYQPFIESTAGAETTLGGIIETNPGYAYRTFSVTVGKTDYSYAAINALMKPILQEYSLPRPFIFDADCTMDEVVLGVLDSNRIGFDILPINDGTGKYTAQFTIGIEERFAGELR
jgi:hypothetical protein